MRFVRFRVQNYRSVRDSGPIEVGSVTAFVGQNEAGKSNLFEALYRSNPFEPDAAYDIDEDWPVDDWGNKDPASEASVCQAEFVLEDPTQIAQLIAAAAPEHEKTAKGRPHAPGAAPASISIVIARGYAGPITRRIADPELATSLDADRVDAWLREHVPKFVCIREYDLEGSRAELDQLAARYRTLGWAGLSQGEQTILTVLELAKLKIDDFLDKGATQAGRTVRAFDKVAASAYLSTQFNQLWSQKQVRFNIDIDGTTLNIFVEDAGLAMPVRLENRSTGFRWHVSFAWKFTHATNGQYRNCILLLEGPGIHLHFAGQRDVLTVFERLVAKGRNQILYTTHLSSMIDLANPERVRIVETQEHHTVVRNGIVSAQRAPMAVIEAALGLAGSLAGLLANRWTLIVEGGIEALILNKLSAILAKSGREGLNERIYLWPADGAAKTPMYAGFAVGQRWDAAVLLDSDAAGEAARQKIQALYLPGGATAAGFKVLMLGQASGVKKNECSIEDLLSDDFYLECVNAAYGLSIRASDLPADGSDMIASRIEAVLRNRYGSGGLDKELVLREMLKRFDSWLTVAALPQPLVTAAERLCKSINAAFAVGK
jgi:hypothetical protein